MKKRGQITIFVIIGIVIVVGALIFIGVNRMSDSELSSVGGDEVQNFIEECAYDSLEQIIFYIGLGGGYIFVPENSNEYGIPYYYREGNLLIMEKSELEEEIEIYFNQEFELCLDDFKRFDNIKINAEEIRSKIVIGENEVNLNLDFIVNLEKGETSYILDKFNKITLSNNIGKIHRISKEIVSEDINRENICLNCIYEKIENENLQVDLFEFEDDFVLTIMDDSHQLKESPFKYMFAIKK